MARQPALVSKDDLFKALWPDVAVTDNALTQACLELRQALGDDPSKPTYIQTVARRGYRFIAPVTTTAATRVDRPRASVRGRHWAAAIHRAPQPAIAVLDFTNVSGDRELAWLSSGIAETVTNDLRATSPLRVVDRVRVVEAVQARRAGPVGARAELHLDLAVVGSFQRSGNALRITARVVDAATGEATAEAKADGLLEQVFDLQDRIVAQFADALRMGGRQPRSVGDTSSLEAYRAFTEGRVRLESLDASAVPAAIADFERAIALDPRYAAAHVGLANARFWQYEMSRARNQPDAALLARAIDHVRRAIELERDLADAHATLSFLLMSAGRAAEALPRRGAPCARAADTGATSSGWRTPRGARNGCRRWRGRWTSIRIFRSCTSRWRWCTSRAASRSRRVGAARRHDRPGSPGRSQAALSREGPALAARPRPAASADVIEARSSSSARSRPARGSSTRPSSR